MALEVVRGRSQPVQIKQVTPAPSTEVVERGLQGPQGSQGDAGNTPIPGPQGSPGQPRWHGAGPPDMVIVGAAPGDEYLDDTTGDIYTLT